MPKVVVVVGGDARGRDEDLAGNVTASVDEVHPLQDMPDQAYHLRGEMFDLAASQGLLDLAASVPPEIVLEDEFHAVAYPYNASWEMEDSAQGISKYKTFRLDDTSRNLLVRAFVHRPLLGRVVKWCNNFLSRIIL